MLVVFGYAKNDSVKAGLPGGQPAINTIEFVTMATDGNAVDFGDFTTAVKVAGSCCNAQGGI